MKTFKALVTGMVLAASMLLAASTGATNVDWDLHVGSGAGGIYIPAPVIVQPQPVYVQAQPVYVERRNGYWKCNKHNKCKWKKNKHREHDDDD